MANREKKKVAAVISKEYNKMTERINADKNTQLAKQLEADLDKVKEEPEITRRKETLLSDETGITSRKESLLSN